METNKIIKKLVLIAIPRTIVKTDNSYKFNIPYSTNHSVIEVDFKLQVLVQARLLCSVSIDGYKYLSNVQVDLELLQFVNHALASKLAKYNTKVREKASSKASKVIESIMNV